MSPKNKKGSLDIDNREAKKTVVQRFMTPDAETSKPAGQVPELVEQQPEVMPFLKSKETDGSQSDKIEEALLERARKPLDESIANAKSNPFVQAKPKNLASKPEELVVVEVTEVEPVKRDIASKPGEIVVVEVTELETTNVGRDKITEKVEGVEEVEDVSEYEAEFSLESVLVKSQDKFDKLMKENNELTDEDKANVESTLNGAVVKKVVKRAYDYDDEGISDYVDTLEKDDEKSKYYFKNSLEEIVVEEVAAILKRAPDMCKCEKCFADICAVALNSLAPRYVTTAMGELHSRISMLNFYKQIEISTEVFNAVDIARKNPRHTVPRA